MSDTRSEWTDRRIEDRFDQLDKTITRLESITTDLNRIFVGFLSTLIIGLVGALVTVLVTVI